MFTSSKKNGYALKYVKEQINEICLEAVKQNGYALEYVKEQTEEICLEAVKQNGNAFIYIKQQANEICLEAVKQNGLVLEYVKEQTNEICLQAVKNNGYALRFVKKQTKEICLEALKQNGKALVYINKQTKEICLEAVKRNIDSLIYVNIKYVKFIYKYLKSINFKYLDFNLHFIINKNVNDCIKYYTVNKNVYIHGIKYLKQDLSLCKSIIKYDKDLSYVNYKKPKLCLQIIKTYNKGFQYINKQYIQVLL